MQIPESIIKLACEDLEEEDMVEFANIPLESREVGSVSGEYFRAKIYITPDDEVAVAVEIHVTATQNQLNADNMNVRIREEAIRATGREPDYYQESKKDFSD